MRIHTNATRQTISEAISKAGVTAIRLTEHKSRTHARAFDVALAGSSKRRGQADRNEYAGTWDEWGIFLATIFDEDIATKCPAYNGADDFHHKTGYRFENGAPGDAHGDHTFRYSGTPYVQGCTKCSATMTWR